MTTARSVIEFTAFFIGWLIVFSTIGYRCSNHEAEPEYVAKQTHYEVLGLERCASQREIRKGYHALALKYHPDKNPDTEELFRLVAEAHKTLSSKYSRFVYDRELESTHGVVDCGNVDDSEDVYRNVYRRDNRDASDASDANDSNQDGQDGHVDYHRILADLRVFVTNFVDRFCERFYERIYVTFENFINRFRERFYEKVYPKLVTVFLVFVCAEAALIVFTAK